MASDQFPHTWTRTFTFKLHEEAGDFVNPLNITKTEGSETNFNLPQLDSLPENTQQKEEKGCSVAKPTRIFQTFWL